MRATLISWTTDPLITLRAIWEASKTDEPLADILRRAEAEADREPDDAAEWFAGVMEQEIPVMENIVFTFVCEDVPISWREQAVRHRVGVEYGPNFAVDVIPEASGSFWSQSHRIKDMSAFAARDEYYIPDSIASDPNARARYVGMMADISWAYRDLVDMGIPMEDARNLLPLGTTHRISMRVDLRALKGIVGKRSCWILQAGIWGPIIESMVDELTTKVSPVFRALVQPPCVSRGKFTECKFKTENVRRLSGADALPVCPLYWTRHTNNASVSHELAAQIEARTPMYARLWDQPNLSMTWNWEDRGE